MKDRDTSNFKDDILEAASGEPITDIVIGEDRRSPQCYDAPKHKGDYELVGMGIAEVVLDYDYDTDYGGADCHAIVAWTETKVIFVSEYDGATSLVSVPRNPVSCMPEMI